MFFSLNQAGFNLGLMQEIKNYLENLPGTYGLYKDLFKVTALKSLDPKHKTAYRIKISNTSYFREGLIPFFFELCWISQKRLDFEDWV